MIIVVTVLIVRVKWEHLVHAEGEGLKHHENKKKNSQWCAIKFQHIAYPWKGNQIFNFSLKNKNPGYPNGLAVN